MAEQIMRAGDAISGSQASIHATIDGKRYKLINLISFEASFESKEVDIPILGSINKGHKIVGGNGKWKGKGHFNNSLFQEIIINYQNTGYMPYFTIQVSIEDPSSAVGRQTTVFQDCLISGEMLVTKFDADADYIDFDIEGSYGRVEMPEKFKMLAGME